MLMTTWAALTWSASTPLTSHRCVVTAPLLSQHSVAMAPPPRLALPVVRERASTSTMMESSTMGGAQASSAAPPRLRLGRLMVANAYGKYGILYPFLPVYLKAYLQLSRMIHPDKLSRHFDQATRAFQELVR